MKTSGKYNNDERYSPRDGEHWLKKINTVRLRNLADEAWGRIGETQVKDVAFDPWKADFGHRPYSWTSRRPSPPRCCLLTRAVSETLRRACGIHCMRLHFYWLRCAHCYLLQTSRRSSVRALKTTNIIATKRKNTFTHHDGSYLTVCTLSLQLWSEIT